MESHNGLGSSSDTLSSLYAEWKRIHDIHPSEDFSQRNAAIEHFLEGFNRLGEEDRMQLDRLNRCENIASALSRQLLLLIYEICDRSVKRLSAGDSETTAASSNSEDRTASSAETDLASERDHGERDTTNDSSNGTTIDNGGFQDAPVALPPASVDLNENRRHWLKDFFLNGIGGRLLQTLARIGAKDIANGREITAVLVRILPTTRWFAVSDASRDPSLETCPGYAEYVRSVLGFRSFNDDGREGRKRSFCDPPASMFEGFQTRDTIHHAAMPVELPQYDHLQLRYMTKLSQDQFTLTVLNLLESLIVHENVLTIDENSVTVSCLRVALEQLKCQERLEEGVTNRRILRHKLLGLVMLCLNNLFFLETLDSPDVSLRMVASDMMELLQRELREAPSPTTLNVVWAEFVHNLAYAIVSIVNHTFLHFSRNFESEQIFMSIFKLLESNLETMKHTYTQLQLAIVPQPSSGLIDMLLKMLENFILVLAPARSHSGKRARKCRVRLHHSRQEPRAAYVCALEHLLLNFFPIAKHTDQRSLVSFFKVHQLCCCNTNAHTLEVLLKLSNGDLIPKLRLSFTARTVVYAIFHRSQCVTCESDRAANTFYEQFTHTHRDVFWEFGRPENRYCCMPTFLRYLLDIVRVVPYRLKAFIVQELVQKLLSDELSNIVEKTQPEYDDGWKEVVNGCLLIVCRAATAEEAMMELFYCDANMDLLRVLSGRLELSHNMHAIMTIGIRAMEALGRLPIVRQLIGILLNELDKRGAYLVSVLAAAANSRTVDVELKPIEWTTGNNKEPLDEPFEATLQLHLEHWKTVRHLLKQSECFRRAFLDRYQGRKGVQRFLDLSCNLASVCLYRSEPCGEDGDTGSGFLGPVSFQIGQLVAPSDEPELRSVLNIFHYSDQLIDGSLSTESFYYSATGQESPAQVSYSPSQEEDFSFLRELRLGIDWQLPGTTRGVTERLGFGKLEKKWSISELFNIRQMLADLMEGYLPRSKQTSSGRIGILPDATRKLLDAGSPVVRKKLTHLFETIVASMQLLSTADVSSNESVASEQGEWKRNYNVMQLALFELKRLLLSNAINNWDCPGKANDVMNVLQALIKVAEMRKETNQQRCGKESFSEREKSYDEEDHLASLGPPIHADDNMADDVSSTDESYTTARDDGYEGDVEIETNHVPQSRHGLPTYQRNRQTEEGGKQSVGSMNANICTLVTEILVELSARCAESPDHWCSVLSQMVVKLNMIRHCLGGALYLIRGFASVLQRNDSRLKELQSSIMDLIVDLNNPDVLVRFVQLLGHPDPPVQSILTKLTKLFEASSAVECYQSVAFPTLNTSHTFWSSSDVLLAKKITFLREHHLHFGVRSGFTDSAVVVPLNYASFYPWNSSGFTVSLWFRAVQLADNQRSDCTHLLTIGSEKQLLSVYFSAQRQLIVRYSKPDRILTTSNTERYLAAACGAQCCESCAKEMLHLWTYKHLLRTITDASSLTFQLDAPGAQCVYCFKALPVGAKGRRDASEPVSDAGDVSIFRQIIVGQDWSAPEDCWSMLSLSVQQTDENVSLTITLDGVQQLARLTLPNGSRIHIDTDLTVLGIGHRASNVNECSVGYDLSGVHLFGRCITDEAALANLYAIGPNVNNFGAVVNGYIVPNYGTLNLAKLTVSDLRLGASIRLLERSHLGCWVAHRAECFVVRNQSIGLMSFGGKLRPTENASLQRSLLVAGGISVMLVCFARVVELSDSPNLQAAALQLLLGIAHSNNDFYNEFVLCNHLELIDIVLKSKRCHKDIALLTTLLEVAFDQPIVAKRGDQYRVLSASVARVRYPAIVTFVLENFHIWIDQSEEVLDLLFDTLAIATRDKHPAMEYNCQRLQDGLLVPALIDFCRVNFVIPAKTVKISRRAADLLVALIAILSPTPPRVPLLNEIMELLLLMHKPTDSYVTHDRQKFYFNISPAYGGGGGGAGSGKRTDRTHATGSGVTGGSSGNSGIATPKMQLRDRRMRPALRKILPLSIYSSTNNSSSIEETTSFIIDSSRSTNTSVVSDESGVKVAPKSPTSTTSPEGVVDEESYERLNKALADFKIRRKSVQAIGEKGAGGGKLKLRRLNSSPSMRSVLGIRAGMRSGSPRSAGGSPKASCLRNELNRTPNHHNRSPPAPAAPARYKFFEQNFFATGNDFLQESFLRVMCDFLLILPDDDARQFLSGENRILETLLVLANNGNIRIRTVLLNLVAVIDDRIDGARASGGGQGMASGPTGSVQYSEEQSKIFWYHLANQIGAHSVNEELLSSCLRWVTKSNTPPEALVADPIEVIRVNGLNVLIAIMIQARSEPPLFRGVLQVIENICTKRPRQGGQYIIDNGLVWALIKTAVKMHEKEDPGQAESRLYLLDFLTHFSHLMILKNVPNPFWDLLNGLTVVEKHKSERVTKAVRDIHATLFRNVLQIFIFRPKQSIIGNKSVSFTVELAGCELSRAEVKTRFNRLHDKAVQFVTNSDPEGELSDAEMALIRHLMNRTLNGNPRGGNIILWCLLPKRSISLKIYTIKQLRSYLEAGGSHLSAICDIKMLKVFVQSIMLLNQKHNPPVEDLRLVNAFYQSIDGGVAHSSSWNLTQTLKDFEYLRTINMNDQEQTILKSVTRQEKLISACTVAAMQITRNSVEKQNRLRKELIIQLRKDSDYRYYDQWRQLVSRMTHEGAPWYSAATYPSSWERDDTYGPDMALRRMRRCQLSIDKRFLLKETQPEDGSEDEKGGLLGYLFHRDYRHEYTVEEQVLYTFTVQKISPSQELPCECILTSTEMVLKPYDGELEIYDLHDIVKIWTKRYQQQESAVEVLLKSGHSLFIVFDRDPSERDTFEGFFHDLVVRCGRQELDSCSQQWREGSLSTWEYLMLLNQVSGRTYHDLMQYPVYPWVLASYDSRTLDLLAERTFRNLEKPIAVQHRELEKHYINNYNNLRQAESGADPIGDRRKIQPYHYSSLYSNSGTVLHFLVRVFPFTSLFLHYQDDSFDIPDRTFHSLQTTWNLASRDSPTDVKELIPEFFTFPEFLENREGLDFGVRQSGEPVNHVELPAWCNNSSRLFVLIHRQALESSVVRRQLSHWIDLIFGYKQTGQAAIDAINVFHPATHCDFSVADIDDPVMKLALETMVKTYGQMPRRLFEMPHPPPGMNFFGANPPKVLDSVSGLRWGVYCGTPVLPSPRLADAWAMPVREQSERVEVNRNLSVSPASSLVALDGDRVFVMPERMNVFCVSHGSTKKHYTISWGEPDERIRIRPLQDNESDARSRELFYGNNNNACDPVTACGTDPGCSSIFFGHRSGRIAVFQQRSRRRRVSFFNQHMQPSVTVVRSRSSSFRRWIDRKSANLRRRLELDGESDSQQQQLPEEHQMEWNYPILLLKHRAPVSAIRVSMEFKIAVSVSLDGCAVIWDINNLSYVREIPKPVNVLHSRISEVTISPTMGDIVTVYSQAGGLSSLATQDSWSSTTLMEEDDSFEVTENYNVDYVNISMTTHRDQLRLYTVNAQYVDHVFLESPIQAITYSSVKEGCGVNCIVVALDTGIVRFYSSWNLALLREINVEPHDVRCALFSKYQHLLLLTGHNTVQTWTAEGLPGPLPTIQEPYHCGGQ
ncbi:lysosomal-trafficking regulator [Anopheles cruzii]|uniref:lysosomal-trafficking regulator n=1 Tax=Anopheles cruzii TaxID=68878 RepID=UPI0022EC6E39|nr:lysosomal-trafficking regulator [Anopheles cruzii]